jgi:hypothetical protein
LFPLSGIHPQCAWSDPLGRRSAWKGGLETSTNLRLKPALPKPEHSAPDDSSTGQSRQQGSLKPDEHLVPGAAPTKLDDLTDIDRVNVASGKDGARIVLSNPCGPSCVLSPSLLTKWDFFSDFVATLRHPKRQESFGRFHAQTRSWSTSIIHERRRPDPLIPADTTPFSCVRQPAMQGGA